MTDPGRKLVAQIRADYKRLSTPENLMNAGQFERGGEENWVLRSPLVRKLAADRFRQVRDRPKNEIFDLCNALLDAGFSVVAFDWALRCRKDFTAADFVTFERWVDRYVDDWSACDDLCMGAFGIFVFDFPKTVSRSNKWLSKNLWFRRAACVCLIYSLRRGLLLDEAFRRAEVLLKDPEDLVQKGYGWMLKEASREFENEVFEFVMKRKATMPRTALRYAIEKMSANKRAAAMKKT